MKKNPFTAGRYASVVSTLALVVALGGTSYAALSVPAHSVGTAQLKNHAVTGAKLSAGAVTANSVKRGSLLGSDFKSGQLPSGPGAPGAAGAQGPKGDPGSQGPPGPQGTAVAFANVNPNNGGTPTFTGTPKGFTSVYLGASTPGYYCLSGVTLTPSSVVLATVDDVGHIDSNYGQAVVGVDTSPNAAICNAGDILVYTYDPAQGLINSQASISVTVN